ACWPMIEVESATAPLAKNVEQRGYLVDELQDFLQRDVETNVNEGNVIFVCLIFR
ncbi:hypothetical protein AK812_SmicGene48205, partial [Symbiodinium microadriaticum]